MSDQATASPLQRPRKRWRKTKWFYGIVLVYYAVTITTAVWWSAYSHRKFQEVVDPIIARGEPLAWSDFATEPIPDDQNAAILYKQAIELPFLKDCETELIRKFGRDVEPWNQGLLYVLSEFTEKREFRRKYSEEIRELLEMAEDAFVLCRKARQLDKVDWGIDFGGEPIKAESSLEQFPYVFFSGLLCLASIEAHETGRDDDAVEYLRDAVAMGDSLTTIPASLSLRINLATVFPIHQSLEEILPGIRIGATPGSVHPRDLRGLLDDLQDMTRCYQRTPLAMMGERSSCYHLCRRILNSDTAIEQMATDSGVGAYGGSSRLGGSARWGLESPIAPMLRIDGAWLINYWSAHVDASKVRTLPEFRLAIHQTQQDTEEYLEGDMVSRLLSSIMIMSLDYTVEKHYRDLAIRKMAAAAIAVRMYRDARGRLPDTLGDLVPDYLAEVPRDPMAEPGKLIHYIKDPNMPRLYSVGKDGRDDGGDYDDLAEDIDDRKDILFFLSGRPGSSGEDSDRDALDDADGDN